MNVAGELIFARSALAGDEEGGIGLGHAFCNLEHAARCRVFRHPLNARLAHAEAASSRAMESSRGAGLSAGTSGTSYRGAWRHRRSIS